MNDLEKLITDLSNYWDLSPEKVVDRLNHMNESEIKNVVNKMTKKFQTGGFLSNGMPIGNKMIISRVSDLAPKRTVSDEDIKLAAQRANEQQAEQLRRNAESLKSQMFNAQLELMNRRQPSIKPQSSVQPLETGPVGPKYYNGPRPKFEDGGIMKCLKGGKTYAECKKCGGSVDKAESGVKLTKKQTKKLAAKNKGITGSNFAISYQNAKNALRQQGLRGNELRDRARIMVSGISPQSAPLITPKPFAGPTATVNNTFVAERPELLKSKAEHEYEHLMKQRANTKIAIENADKFGDAFNMARKAGMLTFKWKGKEYSTRTKDEQDLINKHINAELNNDKLNYNFLLTRPDFSSTYMREWAQELGVPASKLPFEVIGDTHKYSIEIPRYIDVVEDPIYEQPITKQDVREERLRRAVRSLGSNLYDFD